MSPAPPPEDREWLAPLSEFVRDRLGLEFSESRWEDLHRGFLNAVDASEFEGPQAYWQWLKSGEPGPQALSVLAGYLTIGETYFFREKDHFEPMARHLFGDLIERKRKSGDRRLRIWSAACSSGEEPYSLAILLDAMLPDLEEWSIRILATDINVDFLERARAGVYRRWSFRGTPDWVQRRYFRPEGDCFVLLPEIRNRVVFDVLNLVDESYPSLSTQTQAMDLIFCRNVLIYFAAEQAYAVMDRMQRALVEGGWLVVSPTEAMYAGRPPLHRVHIRDSILFQKRTGDRPGVGGGARVRPEPMAGSARVLDARVTGQETRRFFEPAEGLQPEATVRGDEGAGTGTGSVATDDAGYGAEIEELYRRGRHRETVARIFAHRKGGVVCAREAYWLARAEANLGGLDEALEHVLGAIEEDKLRPEFHYLLAMIQMERGVPDEAARALQRVLYLDEHHVMALFSLGHLSQQQGKTGAAKTYFQQALGRLSSMDSRALIPEGEGMTAGHLKEMIEAALP